MKALYLSIVSGLAAAWMSTSIGLAQSTSIDAITYLYGPEAARLRFATSSTDYYRIEFSPDASFTNTTPVVRTMVLGNSSAAEWDDPTVAGFTNGFYRLRVIPQNQSLDYDGDGLLDVDELTYPSCFNAMVAVAGEATGDCDNDGISNQTELNQDTDPTVANPPAGRKGLVINEVDYDQVGTDSAEFVEIRNTSTNTISLTGISLVLVNGATNPGATYTTISLAGAGSLPAGGYLVVAPPAMVITNTALVVRFSVASNNIQNGANNVPNTAPDGLALIDTTTGVVLDALSYEGSITAVNIAGVGVVSLVEGTATAVADETGTSFAFSMARRLDGQDTNDASVDWALSTALTPGFANQTGP